MRFKLFKRGKKGWDTEHRDLPPEEVKVVRRTLRAMLAFRLSEAHKTKPDANNFDVTPVGEYIWGHTSGTCTELSAAGICVGCLGSGNADGLGGGAAKKCDHCKGTGDFDAPPEVWVINRRIIVTFKETDTRPERTEVQDVEYVACKDSKEKAIAVVLGEVEKDKRRTQNNATDQKGYESVDGYFHDVTWTADPDGTIQKTYKYAACRHYPT